MANFVNDGDFPSLPADSAKNHPHLIDIGTFDRREEERLYEETISSTFDIWDVVVTLLHTISPETLRNFLDGTKNEFKVVLAWKNNPNRVLV
jgi:hypothetical protein